MTRFLPAQKTLDTLKNLVQRLSSSTKRKASAISLLRKLGERMYHPWFTGYAHDGFAVPETLSGRPLDQIGRSLDLSAPILFLARGHSGTTPLAKVLAAAGVNIGNTQDTNALNPTLDALYWVFGFQRTLLPRLFKSGVGCLVDEKTISMVALACLQRHLGAGVSGTWGFKTCAGMFAHSLYRYVFPRAKYIYLVRDGRDVILSGDGYFHLTHPFSRHQHWEYFKILTFGISGDIDTCPFDFPIQPQANDLVMQNRFWIQAKSWREHVRMMEYLRATDQLSAHVHTVRYETLCNDPAPVLAQLFDFLELEFTAEIEDFASKTLHTRSVGRWKQYRKHISECRENIDAVFASMDPELQILGYTEG